MGNISILYANVLDDSTLAATNVATNSSVIYLADNRVSYQFASAITGTQTVIQIDQPGSSIDPWRYLVLAEHSMAGGTAVVLTYPNSLRTVPTVVFSGTLTADDPNVTDLGSEYSAQYIDVKLTASGVSSTVRAGELGLMRKFDSPRAPDINVPTKSNPKRTYIDLPNGERLSIRHASPGKVKSFRINGLTQAQAVSWLDIFEANEGIKLVILTDDEGETYPCYLNQVFVQDRELNIFSVELEFSQVKL